ncbi:uncharacterized protein CCOS01_11664 [Colletotrichum costaricense]|uniref:Uncharacterized protein n=1 Tax=Colletotrichum costaricense TaxID=1209916 RepID=A0AAI9YPS0_9PEZI|nr:uncharacterized protein CCOS01_11664 [Colletotrichum costaricense]KAK1518844.1 hypothetical protein CCOS01_11664 [Colletotrichum costaricense]
MEKHNTRGNVCGEVSFALLQGFISVWARLRGKP